MTLPLGELAQLVDGQRGVPELLAALPGCTPDAVIDAVAWLERYGFIEPGWVTGRIPLRWLGESLTGSESRLLGLLATHLEALFEVSATFGGPLPVFAGFLRRREAVTRCIVSGRGLTRRQAVLSCLGEAAERVSAAFRGDEPLVRASFTSLGEKAVHPHLLLNFSEQQYAMRAAGNAQGNVQDAGDSWVPHPFSEDRAVGWAAARPLRGGAEKLVPAAHVYFDYPGDGQIPCFCIANSNGCASAASLEVAIERAFLELVERDAVAIWWYNRLRRPGVAPPVLEQPAIAAVAGWQAERQRTLQLLDLTSDLAVPVCAAVTRDHDGGRIVFGFGAAWDPQAAALSAVTEMQQVYLSALLIEEARAAETAERPSHAARALQRWLATATIATQPYLVPSPDDAARGVPCSDRPGSKAGDCAVPALDRIAGRCEKWGLEPLVIDLTRADIGVPTARVMVPGLRHFWARFGPGRLYDVPVALGWRPTACPEAELNPVALFI